MKKKNAKRFHLHGIGASVLAFMLYAEVASAQANTNPTTFIPSGYSDPNSRSSPACAPNFCGGQSVYLRFNNPQAGDGTFTFDIQLKSAGGLGTRSRLVDETQISIGTSALYFHHRPETFEMSDFCVGAAIDPFAGNYQPAARIRNDNKDDNDGFSILLVAASNEDSYGREHPSDCTDSSNCFVGLTDGYQDYVRFTCTGAGLTEDLSSLSFSSEGWDGAISEVIDTNMGRKRKEFSVPFRAIAVNHLKYVPLDGTPYVKEARVFSPVITATARLTTVELEMSEAVDNVSANDFDLILAADGAAVVTAPAITLADESRGNGIATIVLTLEGEFTDDLVLRHDSDGDIAGAGGAIGNSRPLADIDANVDAPGVTGMTYSGGSTAGSLTVSFSESVRPGLRNSETIGRKNEFLPGDFTVTADGFSITVMDGITDERSGDLTQSAADTLGTDTITLPLERPVWEGAVLQVELAPYSIRKSAGFPPADNAAANADNPNYALQYQSFALLSTTATDTDAPTVAFNGGNYDGDTVTYKVTFSEPITATQIGSANFALYRLTSNSPGVIGSGARQTATATVTPVRETGGLALAYNVAFSGVGAITPFFVAEIAGTITDRVGNPLDVPVRADSVAKENIAVIDIALDNESSDTDFTNTSALAEDENLYATVTLDRPFPEDGEIDYRILPVMSDSIAAHDVEVNFGTSATNTVEVTSGSAILTFSVGLNDDNRIDSAHTENGIVKIDAVRWGSGVFDRSIDVSGTSATFSITDNDQLSLSVADASVRAGGILSYTVNAEALPFPDTATDVILDRAVMASLISADSDPQSAVEGPDYTGYPADRGSANVVFAAMPTAANVFTSDAINFVMRDTRATQDKTFRVVLRPSGDPAAMLSTTAATITIRSRPLELVGIIVDNGMENVSTSALDEDQNLYVTVTLDHPLPQDGEIDYRILPYLSDSISSHDVLVNFGETTRNTVAVNANTTTLTFSVDIADDNRIDSAHVENGIVKIDAVRWGLGASAGSIDASGTSATFSITDNDRLNLSIASASVLAGDTLNYTVNATASPFPDTAAGVILDRAVVAGLISTDSDPQSAVEGPDYTGYPAHQGSASVVFAAMPTAAGDFASGAINFVTFDISAAQNKTLKVILISSGDSAAMLSTTAATITIRPRPPERVIGIMVDDDNDDATDASTSALVESEDLHITVTMDRPLLENGAIDYRILPGMFDPIAAHDVAVGFGDTINTAAVAGGSITLTFSVNVNDNDRRIDSAHVENGIVEIVAVRWGSDASVARIASSASATFSITDNDQYQLSIQDYQVMSGDRVAFGVRGNVVPVPPGNGQLSSDRELSFALSTADGLAIAAQDYTALDETTSYPIEKFTNARTFSPSTVNITTLNTGTMDVKTFTVEALSADPAVVVNPSPSSATVTIFPRFTGSVTLTADGLAAGPYTIIRVDQNPPTMAEATLAITGAPANRDARITVALNVNEMLGGRRFTGIIKSPTFSGQGEPDISLSVNGVTDICSVESTSEGEDAEVTGFRCVFTLRADANGMLGATFTFTGLDDADFFSVGSFGFFSLIIDVMRDEFIEFHSINMRFDYDGNGVFDEIDIAAENTLRIAIDVIDGNGDDGICGRTRAVWIAITQEIGEANVGSVSDVPSCSNVMRSGAPGPYNNLTELNYSSELLIAAAGPSFTGFKAGDLDDLTALPRLIINSNDSLAEPFPANLFDDLDSIHHLEIQENSRELTSADFPDGIFDTVLDTLGTGSGETGLFLDDIFTGAVRFSPGQEGMILEQGSTHVVNIQLDREVPVAARLTVSAAGVIGTAIIPADAPANTPLPVMLSVSDNVRADRLVMEGLTLGTTGSGDTLEFTPITRADGTAIPDNIVSELLGLNTGSLRFRVTGHAPSRSINNITLDGDTITFHEHQDLKVVLTLGLPLPQDGEIDYRILPGMPNPIAAHDVAVGFGDIINTAAVSSGNTTLTFDVNINDDNRIDRDMENGIVKIVAVRWGSGALSGSISSNLEHNFIISDNDRLRLSVVPASVRAGNTLHYRVNAVALPIPFTETGLILDRPVIAVLNSQNASAMDGMDYTGYPANRGSANVVFAATPTAASVFTSDVINFVTRDTRTAQNKIFRVELRSQCDGCTGVNRAVGLDQGGATITILPNAPTTIEGVAVDDELSNSDDTNTDAINENQDLYVTVTLDQPLPAAGEIKYRILPGDSDSIDQDDVDSMVNFGEGAVNTVPASGTTLSYTFGVGATDNDLVEGTKNGIVEIISVSWEGNSDAEIKAGSITPGTPLTAAFTIVDNDEFYAVNLAPGQTNVTGAETGSGYPGTEGGFALRVRGGPSSGGDARVILALSGTAKAGDYTLSASTGTLIFSDGTTVGSLVAALDTTVTFTVAAVSGQAITENANLVIAVNSVESAASGAGGLGPSADKPQTEFILSPTPQANLRLSGLGTSGTIVENDPRANAGFEEVMVLEISGIPPGTTNVVVEYTITTGTGRAVPGEDYHLRIDGTTINSFDGAMGTVAIEVEDSDTDHTMEIAAQVFNDRRVGAVGAVSLRIVRILFPQVSGGVLTALPGEQSLEILDAGAPDVEISMVSEPLNIAEGASGEVTIAITPLVPQDVAIAWEVVSSEADNAGSNIGTGDFAAAAGTAEIAGDTTSVSVNIETANDNILETHEVFEFRIGSIEAGDSNVALGTSETKLTILDDEIPSGGRVTMELESSALQVNEGGGALTINVLLSEVLTRDARAVLRFNDGSAGSPADYAYAGEESLEIMILQGRTSDSVAVTITDDNILESDETFTVGLTLPADGVTGDVRLDGLIALGAGTTATVAIEDNEQIVVGFSPASYQVVEGSDSVVVVGVEFFTENSSFADASARAFTVTVSTIDGTATAGNDYTAVRNRELVFMPGETMKMVEIPLVDNFEVENAVSTTFVLNLATSDGSVALAPASARVEIEDDELPYEVASFAIVREGGVPLDDVIDDEGGYSGSTGHAVLRISGGAVSRNGPVSRPNARVVLGFGGAAVKGRDYTVSLSGGVGGTLDGQNGYEVGRDAEDTEITVSIFAARNVDSNLGLVVSVARVEQAGAAEMGDDFSGSSVSFTLSPSPASSLSLHGDFSSGEIAEDHTGANAGFEEVMALEVSDIPLGAANMVVEYTITTGTGRAVPGEDYHLRIGGTTISSLDEAMGTVAIELEDSGASTDHTIEIAAQVFNDRRVGTVGPMSLRIGRILFPQVSGGVLTALPGEQSLKILDAGAPDVGISIVSEPLNIAEGASGEVTISITPLVPQDVTIAWEMVSSEADNAGSNIGTGDFAATAGTAEIAGDTASVFVNIETVNDNILETHEVFEFRMGSIDAGDSNVALGTSATKLTILDDETPSGGGATMELESSALQVNEDGGALTINVLLSEVLTRDARAVLRFNDGSAGSPADYAEHNSGNRLISLPITIPQGESNVQATVAITDDNILESDEIFIVGLTLPEGGVTGDARLDGLIALGAGTTATATIEDNEQIVVGFSPASYQVVEGSDSAVVVGVEFFTGNPGSADASAKPFTVTVSTIDGTATAGNDYTAVQNRELVFMPGETMKRVEISLVDNFEVEAEVSTTFVLNLATSDGSVALAPASARVEIEDDELPYEVASFAVVREGGVLLDDVIDDGDGYSGSTGRAVLRISGGAMSRNGSVSRPDAKVVLGFGGAAIKGSDYTVSLSGGVGDTLDAQNSYEVGRDAEDTEITVSISAARNVDSNLELEMSVLRVEQAGDSTMGDDFSGSSVSFTLSPSPASSLSLHEDFSSGEIAEDHTGANAGFEEMMALEISGIPPGTTNVVVEYTITTGTGHAVPGEDYHLRMGGTTINSFDEAMGTVAIEVEDSGASTDRTMEIAAQMFNDRRVGVVGAVSLRIERILFPQVSGGVLTASPGEQSLEILDAGAPDVRVSIVLESLNIAEGASGEVTISITPLVPQDVTIAWEVVSSEADNAGSNIGTGDFAAMAGTAEIAGDTTSVSVNIETVNDNILETHEVFEFRMGSIDAGDSNVTRGASETKLTILDDEIPSGGRVTMELESSALQVRERGGTLTIESLLSEVLTRDARAVLQFSDGSADSPADYAEHNSRNRLTSLPITVSQGESNVRVTVAITDDNILEFDETFTVRLTLPEDGVTGDTRLDGLIELGARAATTAAIEDNEQAVVGFSPVLYQVVEGSDRAAAVGVKFFTGNPSSADASARPFTVAVSTINGTATAGNDYTAVRNRELVFMPGETMKRVEIPLIDNSDIEATVNTTFRVNLATADGDVILSPASARVEIEDDDEPPYEVASFAIANQGGVPLNDVIDDRGGYSGSIGRAVLRISGGEVSRDGLASRPDARVVLGFGGAAVKGRDYTVSLSGGVGSTLDSRNRYRIRRNTEVTKITVSISAARNVDRNLGLVMSVARVEQAGDSTMGDNFSNSSVSFTLSPSPSATVSLHRNFSSGEIVEDHTGANRNFVRLMSLKINDAPPRAVVLVDYEYNPDDPRYQLRIGSSPGRTTNARGTLTIGRNNSNRSVDYVVPIGIRLVNDRRHTGDLDVEFRVTRIRFLRVSPNAAINASRQRNITITEDDPFGLRVRIRAFLGGPLTQ